MIVETENSFYLVTEIATGYFLVFKARSINGYQPLVKEGEYRLGTELFVRVNSRMTLRKLDGHLFSTSPVVKIHE